MQKDAVEKVKEKETVESHGTITMTVKWVITHNDFGWHVVEEQKSPFENKQRSFNGLKDNRDVIGLIGSRQKLIADALSAREALQALEHSPIK